MSVARKWQLASRLHLLQIGCLPNVLLSSVQWLTDHPCCAAGSSKNRNHNTEEHIDAGSVTVCVPRCCVQFIWIGWRSTNLCACDTALNGNLSGLRGLIYDMPSSELLLFCSHILYLCLINWMNVTHVFVVYIFSGHCMGLDDFKGKGFPKMSRWLR